MALLRVLAAPDVSKTVGTRPNGSLTEARCEKLSIELLGVGVDRDGGGRWAGWYWLPVRGLKLT